MSVDYRLQAILEARSRERVDPSQPQYPLQGGGGGDNSGGMEVRIARLEAHVEHITSEVGKLAGLPAEVARISERLNHMPTKSEMYEAIEAAVDRSSARLQRTIAVVGAMVAIVSGVVTYLVKIAG